MKKFFLLLLLLVTLPSLAALGFRSALKVFEPQAVLRTISVVSAYSDMLTRATPTPQARRLAEFIGNSLEDFDFGKIYQSEYLRADQDGFRSMTLAGEHQAADYRISVSQRDSLEVNLSRAFNAAVRWSLKENLRSPVAGARSFPARVSFRLALEHLNHENISAFLDEMLAVLDPANLARLQPRGSRGYFPQPTNVSDRKIIEAATTDFPHLMGYLDRLITLSSLVQVRQFREKNFTELRLVARLKEVNLRSDYPQLWRWIEYLGEAIHLEAVLYDGRGMHLAGFTANPQQREIRVDLLTSEGRIIPRDSFGNPHFATAFSLKNLKTKKMRLDLRLRANISGLRFDTGWLKISGHYQRAIGQLNFHLEQAEEMRIYGRFYHVVPTWLIDIAIPSDVEQLMRDFITVIQLGNHGRGSSLSLKFARGTARQHYVDGIFETEILDNRFIRLAIKIWNRRLRPEAKAVHELRSVIAAVCEALLKDLRQL